MARQEKEIEILVTGSTVKEIVKGKRQNKEIISCYLCKRKKGDLSYTIQLQNKEVVAHPIIPSFIKKRVNMEGKTYIVNYPICPECRILLGIPEDLNTFIE